jgi:hypothetical protein
VKCSGAEKAAEKTYFPGAGSSAAEKKIRNGEDIRN